MKICISHLEIIYYSVVFVLVRYIVYICTVKAVTSQSVLLCVKPTTKNMELCTVYTSIYSYDIEVSFSYLNSQSFLIHRWFFFWIWYTTVKVSNWLRISIIYSWLNFDTFYFNVCDDFPKAFSWKMSSRENIYWNEWIFDINSWKC